MSVGQFVDLEQLGVLYLAAALPGVKVGIDVPKGPGIRVTRSPGSNDADSALPRLDIECFAPDRASMWILAGRANNALAELAGDVVEINVGTDDQPDVQAVQVDDVNTITDPVPGYWSPTVERSVAVYEFDVRTEF